MALLSRRRGKAGAPRLVPELDDDALADVRKLVSGPPRGSWQADNNVAVVEELLGEPGQDADRRTHRLTTLAEHAGSTARRWRKTHPQNPDALVLYAWSWLATVRAGGEAGDAAYRDLDAALEDCRQASLLRPEDGAPWLAALGILREQRRPWPEIEPVWNELRARDPWNRQAHLEMLGYLSPDECGSRTAERDFVSSVSSTAPPDSPVAALPLEAELRRYRRNLNAGGAASVTADESWRQPMMAEFLKQAQVNWTRPGFLVHAAVLADLNLLAYALVHTANPQDAAEVFRRIGGVVTPWPWNIDGDPVERFTLWHQKFAGEPQR